MVVSGSKWSEENLRKAVDKSVTIAEVLREIGVEGGGHYRTYHKYINLYKIDTSHFLGQSHFKGKKRVLNKISLNEILIENSFYSPRNLKQRLISDGYFVYKCDICDISKWNENYISLHMDHINGNKFDNRIENLRLLCPNCHSQTSTYCAKNRSKKKEKYAKCKCGKKILYSSKMCRSCSGKNSRPNKINWPSISYLKNRLKEVSMVKLGKELGVSDNAVRKHIKKYGSVG